MKANVTIDYRTIGGSCSTWIGSVEGKDHETIAADCVARLKRRSRRVSRIDRVSVVESPWEEYERRVQAYEDTGMTRSDAQGVVDAEDMKAARAAAVRGQ